jgi:hypothetical protein
MNIVVIRISQGCSPTKFMFNHEARLFGMTKAASAQAFE